MNENLDRRALLLEQVKALKPLILSLEEEMEQGRRLPEALRKAFLDARFYQMWVPRELGGLEVDPITYFDVIEAISAISGSAGWNLMLGSSFGIFAAAIPDTAAREVYSPDDSILAGQINGISGRAISVEGGYRVSGKWAFGSGILQSTYVLSNAMLFEGDKVKLDARGEPMSLFVLVPRDKVRILDTWFTMGLCGTGSNDYEIDDVFVPREFTFLRGANGYKSGPLYKLKMAFAYTIPLPLVGIARGAIECFKEIAATKKSKTGQLAKDSEVVQYEVARAEGLLQAGRANLWGAVQDMYATAVRGEAITPAQEMRAMLASVEAGHMSAQALDIVFDAVGGTAVYKSHPLERRFRDIHTAVQHAAMARGKRQALGKQYLDAFHAG